MTTANDLITGALQAVTSVTPGEPVDGGEAANALIVLNRMLKSWSAKRLMIPYRTLENFTWTAGQASFTLGQSGSPSFNTLRPDYVTFVYRRQSPTQDAPLRPMTKDQYNALGDKNTQGQPEWYYYDPQFPNGVLYLYPVPSSNITIFVESLKPVNQFTTLQTEIALPGEYEEPIVYLLAHRLAIGYGFTIPPELAALIEDAEKSIRRKNVRPVAARFDAALTGAPPLNINNG